MTDINSFRAGLLRSSAPQPVLSAQGVKLDGEAVRYGGGSGQGKTATQIGTEAHAEAEAHLQLNPPPAASRAERRAGLRSISDELVRASQQTEVLNHVHPRTRRAEIDAELQAEGR